MVKRCRGVGQDLARMVQCGFFVCMVSTLAKPSLATKDSCHEIGQVLTTRFQIDPSGMEKRTKHSSPTEVDNLFTCKNGVTCCNTVSEFFFEKSVQEELTDFALFTVNTRMNNFKDGMYAKQVNWDVFTSLIERAEIGQPISYEDFFELALYEIINVKRSCYEREEMLKLKEEAMADIIKLVNNIYAYQKGVEAINDTLQATASLKPSQECANMVSKAGIPINMGYRPSGCPLCLDSTAQIKTCRDLCLNVVRGCYSSILVYKQLYLDLIKMMDHIYFSLNYNLEMQNGALYTFIGKIERNFKHKEFKDACVVQAYSHKRKKRGKRMAQGPDMSHFMNYFSKQLALETAIVDPATLPCAGSINSQPCWNGDGLGFYKHLAYSYTREEQEINPEISELGLSPEQEAAVALMESALDLANKTANNQELFTVYKVRDKMGENGTLFPPREDPSTPSSSEQGLPTTPVSSEPPPSTPQSPYMVVTPTVVKSNTLARIDANEVEPSDGEEPDLNNNEMRTADELAAQNNGSDAGPAISLVVVGMVVVCQTFGFIVMR